MLTIDRSDIVDTTVDLADIAVRVVGTADTYDTVLNQTVPLVRNLFEADIDGLMFRVTRVASLSAERVDINGEAYDHQGNSAGSFVRQLRPTQHAMSHIGMGLEVDHQGHRIGTRWVQGCLARYSALLGPTEIDLSAHRVSAYQWARVGFDWQTKSHPGAASLLVAVNTAEANVDGDNDQLNVLRRLQRQILSGEQLHAPQVAVAGAERADAGQIHAGKAVLAALPDTVFCMRQLIT